MRGLVTLHGERITLRPAAPEDVDALLAILSHPDVRPRWAHADPREYLAQELAGDGVATFAIERERAIVGLIQFHEEEDPDYRCAGIDIALHPSVHGQGICTEALGVLVRYLIRDRGHHRLTIDPAADNAPAIRCYEKAGFRRIGIARDYERGMDGTWHDGLLMDLLAEDLPSDAPDGAPMRE